MTNALADPRDAIPMLIDWGLAGRIGDPLHQLTGRRAFMHDDILAADYAAYKASKVNGQKQVRVVSTRGEFDLMALRCTMTAFVYNQKWFTVPWEHFHINALDRNSVLRSHIIEMRDQVRYTTEQVSRYEL